MARAKTLKPAGNGHFSLPPVGVGANPHQKMLDAAKRRAELRGGDEDGFPAAAAVIALGSTQCKWPIGEVRQAGFRFCDEERDPAVPYCEHHMGRAVSREQPLKRLRA